tara:strand:- start:10257 stop:10604 length:348 start_codon:yes stop_codon:yes gene_type:complete
MSIHDTALTLINAYGKKLSLTRQLSGGSVDPVTGIKLAGSFETAFPYGLPISDKQTIGKYFSSVASEEKIFMVDASYKIKPGFQLSTDSGTYRVIDVESEEYKGTAIYYMVKLVK